MSCDRETVPFPQIATVARLSDEKLRYLSPELGWKAREPLTPTHNNFVGQPCPNFLFVLMKSHIPKILGTGFPGT